MSKLTFRDLMADEIDVRVQSIKDNNFILLLYKDARCDMTILDETVGSLGWKRKHLRDNKNCIVSIFDNEKNIWISKEDTGTESNTEQEKGLASDSFKRACFNWGIGRELYTAPFIQVWDTSYIKNKKVYEKFKVSKIEIKDKKIISLEIVDSKNNVVFNTLNKTKPNKNEQNNRNDFDREGIINYLDKRLDKPFVLQKLEEINKRDNKKYKKFQFVKNEDLKNIMSEIKKIKEAKNKNISSNEKTFDEILDNEGE